MAKKINSNEFNKITKKATAFKSGFIEYIQNLNKDFKNFVCETNEKETAEIKNFYVGIGKNKLEGIKWGIARQLANLGYGKNDYETKSNIKMLNKCFVIAFIPSKELK